MPGPAGFERLARTRSRDQGPAFLGPGVSGPGLAQDPGPGKDQESGPGRLLPCLARLTRSTRIESPARDLVPGLPGNGADCDHLAPGHQDREPCQDR
jgi:hypothetical protein